jgi:WD40 repeat protein
MDTQQRNPYVGPRSFETGDPLYGREKELNQLASLLIAERIVLLHSPSGAGKTSLIQAGLIPRLSEDFHILPIIRVGLESQDPTGSANRYTLSTLLSLEERLPENQRRPLQELSRLTLGEYLDTRPRPEEAPNTELLIFDQFEEILTTAPADRAGKQAFFTQLGQALKKRHRWALFATREDFLGQFAPYILPIPNRFNVKFRLDLLNPEAAREAIQNPARNAGVDFTKAAAQKLVDDLRSVLVQLPDGSMETQLGQHVEPVQLQVVCYNLWQGRIIEDKVIDEGDLAKVGDVNHALADYYTDTINRACKSTGVEERLIRDWFDKRLITKEGFRGHVLMGQDSSEGLSNAAIRLLENAHIVRGDKRAGATWFELAHDRLIEPLRKSNAEWFNANLSLFQKQAALWIEQNRPESLLLRRKDLSQAEKESIGIPLNQAERDYLKACRAYRAHVFRQTAVLIGFALLILASLSGAFLSSRRETAMAQQNAATQVALAAIAQTQEAEAVAARATAEVAKADAEKNAELAIAQEKLAKEQAQKNLAAGLAAQAISNKNSNHGLALLLAVESFKIEDTLLARTSLFEVLQHTPYERLFGHRAAVTSVVLNTETGLIASAGCIDNSGADCQQGQIILWDAAKHQPISQLPGLFGFVRSLAFSPDGKTLASAGCVPVTGTYRGCADNKGQIILWDISKPAAPLQLDENSSGHIYQANTVTFSADGLTLASGGNDQNILLWDVSGHRLAKTGEFLTAHQGFINSLAFHPNGNILVSGGADFLLRVWNVSNRQNPVALGGPSGPQNDSITGVAFSPDGQKLASSSRDGKVVLWDWTGSSLQNPQTLSGHNVPVLSVIFSPDGRQLASAGTNGSIILWNVSTLERIGLALDVHTVSIFSLALGQSQPGKLTLVSGSADRSIILWDLSTRQPVAQPVILPPAWAESASSLSATSADQTLAARAEGQNIILSRAGQEVTLPNGHGGPVNSLAFAPQSVDGKQLLVSASDDQTVILWDVTRFPEAVPVFFKLEGFDWPFTNALFSPDGRELATFDSAGNVIIWKIDPNDWRARSCQAANGRALTADEVLRYLGGQEYSGSCP